METKIIEENNTGTVIIEDNASNENSAGGTQIIGETGTQIINEGGTQIIEESQPVSQEPVNSVSQVVRLNGAPLANDVEVLGYKIKNQMNTRSGEADLYLAEKNSITYVFKYYRNSHKPKSAVVEKIKNLKNPHIVKLFDYGFYNDRFFEVYEYAKAGNVNARKKDGTLKYLPLSEEELLKLCKDIVESFNEFHQAGIIHRDIKPDNFLLRNTNPLDIIIGDFGIASVMDEGEELHKTKTQHHTIGYVPREFFTADYKGIGTGIDYYALGITLWEFATGGNPFVNPKTGAARNENHIMRDTFEGRLADDLLSREPKLSPKLQKLIRGLLVTDYEKRWGYSEVTRYLNGEDVEVTETEKRKLKVSVLRQNYEDEQKLSEALWKNRKEVTFAVLSKISDALTDIYSYNAEKIQEIIQDITDKNDLEIPLLKIVCLLNPEMSYELGDGYSISNKDEIIETLESAPEVLISAFKNLESHSFVYLSLVLGNEITEKLKAMIKTETERNKKYYNMSDHMYNLKLISKAKLIIKNEPIKPFISEEYKFIRFEEIEDMVNLDEELKQIIMENVRGNIYEGDIVPWLELKTGKRIEDFNAVARTYNWEQFYKAVSAK